MSCASFPRLLATLAAAFAVGAAMASPQAPPAGGSAPPAGGAAPPAAPAAPVAPASLPSGAEVPPVLPIKKVRADVFYARVQALSNALSCPACQGSGTEVARVREKNGHLGAPAKVHEVRSQCEECKGSGCRADPERIGGALDSLVEAMGALDSGSKIPEKQLERSRQLLLRVGNVAALAEAVVAGDRNAVSAGRRVSQGEALTITGTLGKPIPIPGGGRLLPVGTGGHSAVLVRDPSLNDAPESGTVLVGGCVAGPVGNVEWEWGRVLVLDHGFVVPLRSGAPSGAAAPAPPAAPPVAGSPATSSASPIP